MWKTIWGAKRAYEAYCYSGLTLHPKSHYNSEELKDLAIRYKELFELKDSLDKEFLELAIEDGFSYEEFNSNNSCEVE